MKNNRRNFFLSLLGRFFSASAIVISFFGVSHAAQQSWKTDAATTSWATGTNWVSGTAPTSSITADTALFNQTAYTSQPNAGTTSITGITIGDGTTATAPLTLSGTMLTIGASGLDMKAAAGATSLTSPVTIGAAQTWAVGGTGTLTTSGAITGAALTLTTTGTGTLNFAGAYTGTGVIRLTSAAGTTSNIGVQAGANISSTNIQLFQDNVANGGTNYTQTGGTVTASGAFGIGESAAGGASGRINNATISGGTLTTGNLNLYKWATSNLNVSNSGVVNATSLRIGWSDSSPTGSINVGDGTTFSGGTSINDGGTSGLLTVNAWNIQANRSYTLNFKGGTLKAGAAGTNWLQAGAFTSATVQEAGGIFDNGGFAVNIGQALTHGGAAATDGGMVFKGAGSTTLAGAVGYTGPTKVLAGSVTLPETVVTNGISLFNGATLAISGTTGKTIGSAAPISNLTLGSTPAAGGATLTFNNFVSNSGQQLVDTTNFTANGAPQGVTINVAGSFSGAGDYPLVTFGNSTIGGDGFAALKLGTLPRGITGNLLEDSQILFLQVTGFNPLRWNGTVAGGVWDLNTTANWQGVDTKYQDGDVVILDNTATGTTNVALNSTVSPASVAANNSTYSIAGTGSIAGTTGLSKNGTGTLTLGTNNTYIGLSSVTGGTLKTAHANALGSTTGITEVASGAVLDLNGTALAAEPITLNGTGISSAGALVNNSASIASTASPITLGTAVSVGGSGYMTLSGDITGTTGLTKVGAGVTVFSSKKSYTGDTVVNGGILDLAGGGGTGGAIRGAVTVNSGGTLRLGTGDATGYDITQPRLTTINLVGGTMNVGVTNNQTLGAATISMTGAALIGVPGSNLDFFNTGSAINTLASANPSVVSGVKLNLRQNDGLTFNIADGAAPVDLDVQSAVSSSGGFTNNDLIKTGAGTMRISGSSTYATKTFVNAGRLIVPAVQSSTAFTVADATTLDITGSYGSSLTTTDMTIGTAGATTLNVGNFGSQTLAANAPVKVTGLLTVDGTPTINISGSFASAGVFPVVSYGSLGGLADFQLGTVPRSITGATLVRNDTNLTYDLNIAAVNPVSWNGNVNGNWDTSTANWRINAAATAYQNNDVVVMNDSATGGTAITLNTTVTPNSLTVDNTTKSYSITGSGGLGGSGSLTKSGSGTLTLATANTFYGPTTVNAGTLQLGNGTSNGSVGGNITNNASLVLNNGTAQTYDGIISGTGSLTKQGAGTFALGIAPTSTGATTITAGTLQVPSLSATSSITNNSNLVFKRADAAENNPSGAITGTGNVSYAGPDVALSGIGYYRLDDANSYAGTTTISNARAAVFNSAACGTGPINVTSGGQFWTWNFGLVINNPITLNGIGWNEGSSFGALRLNKAAVLTGPITLASDSRIAVYNSGATDGGGTISGVISGPGGLEVTGNQNNVLVLTGSSSNTYSGATRITSGQVALNKSSGLALTGDITMDNTGSPTMWPTSSTQLSPTALLTFTGNSGNARFNLMGTTQTFRGIVNNSTVGTAVIQNSEAIGGNPNASPVDYGTSNLVLNVPAGEDYAFLNGYLRNSTGVVNVVKNGSGRQTLGGTTTIDYSGTTSINAGELRFYDMDDVQSRAITIASGATLRVEALTTRKFTGNITGGAVWNGTGSIIKSGAGVMEFNGNAATALSLGSGALVDVQQGVLRLGYGAQLNMSANKADLNVASGTTFNNWDCANTYFDALTGSGTVTRGYTPDAATGSTGTGNLVLGVDNGSGSFSGVITDQLNHASSVLNLVKRGAGTQTLSGLNDYDGTTRVEGGTLALSGSGDLPNTSSVTVLSGAVLDVSAKTTTFTQATGKSLIAGRTSGSGNDIVGNFTTGGTIDVAGNGGIGTLTAGGNLSLTGGGTLPLDLSSSAAGTNDKVVATGTLDLAGTTSVVPAFINGTPDTTTPYTILSATGGITGAGTFTNGLVNSRYALAFNNVGNNVQMTVSGTGKALTWSAATGGSWEASVAIPDALTLNWNAGADNFQNLDAVTFDDTAAGTGAVAVALTTNVNPAAMAVNNPTRDYTISGTNGVISGGGKLTKTGAAALTLATANTYSGGTTLSQGTLNLTHGTAAGAGAITLDDAPAGTNALTLNANLASATFANPITVTNNGTGTVTLAQPANFSTLAGTVTLNRATTISGAADRSGVAGRITGNVGTLSFSGGRTTLDNTVPNDFVGNVSILTGATLQTSSVSSIPASASVDIAGTGKLQFNNGVPVALNTLTGGTSGTTGLQIAGGGATTLTLGGNNGSGVFNGNITNNSAALSITKVGTGTLTLGGNNSNYGQTRVLGGTLALTHLSALGGSTLVWDNLGGALDVSTLTTGTLNLGGLLGAQNLSLSGLSLSVGHASNTESTVYTGTVSLSGAGLGFTKRGLGNLTFGGSVSNSWAGNTTIISDGAPGNSSQGNLYLAKTGGAVAIPANTTVNFGTGTNTGQPNIRTLNDNQFGSNVVMNFGNTTAGYCRLDLLGTTQTLAGVTGTAGGAIIQNTGLGNYTGPDVADPATLVLNGTGTYSLTGILRDTDAAANPLRRLNIQKTGSGTQTFANLNGNGFTGFTAVDNGKLVISRTDASNDQYMSTAYSVAAGAELEFANTAAAGTGARISTQTGDIAGGGTISKTGTGVTWLANGTSSQLYLDLAATGLINVQAGALSAISTRATNKADIQIAAGATLGISGGGGTALPKVYFDALNGGSAATNATLDIGASTTAVLGVNGGGGTFYGNVNGAGGITKEGAATLTLTGANAGTPAVPTVNSSFSGDITINGGKLIGAAVRTGNNGVFGSASNTRTITVNAGTTLDFAAPNTFGGHNTINVPTLVVNGGTVTNSDPLATSKINNGLRNVTLNNGTLTSTAANSLSTIDAGRPGEGYGAWGLNGTVTSTGTSQITTTDVSSAAGRILLNSNGVGVDTVFAVTDGTLTVAVPLQGGDGPSGGLNKTGAGKLVLSAANIYSGPTTVNAGTLELTGSLVKASALLLPTNITVAAGATLKGTGQAEGTVAVNGIVAPGSSIGTLATGTANFGATGSLAAEINSTSKTADKLAVTGDLNITSGATLSVTDLGATAVTSAKLVLISYTGAWDGGTFDGLADGGTLAVNGNTYTVDYDDTDAGVNAVTLRIGTVVADPFDAWATSFGLTGLDATKGADPDKDGVKNILEFATASSPTNGTSGPRVYPLMFTIGADNALTFTAAVRTGAVFAASGTKQTATKDQVLYTFEASNELSNWTTVPVTEVTGTTATNIRAALGAKLTAPALGAEWEWHTFRTDLGTQVDPSDYIRLRVNDAP